MQLHRLVRRHVRVSTNTHERAILPNQPTRSYLARVRIPPTLSHKMYDRRFTNALQIPIFLSALSINLSFLSSGLLPRGNFVCRGQRPTATRKVVRARRNEQNLISFLISRLSAFTSNHGCRQKHSRVTCIVC
jgi:hypothetical protein